jgi:endonuclease/exonuclease/phosphatase family metal-dependent hydrolase
MGRRTTTLVMFMAGLGLAATAQAQGEPQAKPRELRVMSYNIKHGRSNAVCTQPPPAPVPPGQPSIPYPDCGLDLDGIAAVVRAHNPDVVGFQEVDRFWARSASIDQPEALAAMLGMPHHCYAPNLDHNPDNHATVPHQYGTVLISRFPILECSNTLLPRTGNAEQRGFTRALINVRGVPLQFYNTHLHTTQTDRLMQTTVIAEILDAAPDGPIVVMGDFNARPNAAEMAPIFARLQDAWLLARQPSPENPNGNTSPARVSGNPTSRIDYVLVSSDVTVAATVVPIDERTRLATDHYPVVSDIALPGGAVGIGNKKTP